MKLLKKSPRVATIVAAFAVTVSTAWAAVDLAKPSAVISFAGYKKTINDLNALGQAVGQPGMGSGLDMMLQMMLQGNQAAFDLNRPCGVLSYYSADTAPGKPCPSLTFVPVTDMQKFILLLEGNGFQSTKLGEDHYQFTLPPSGLPGEPEKQLFAKLQGTWLFLASPEISLDSLPSDPLDLLKGLDKKYLLAIQVYGQNQGVKWLEKTVGEGSQQAQTTLGMMGGGMPLGEQPPAAPAPSLALLGPLGPMLQTMGDQVDTLTIGFLFDQVGTKLTDLQLDLEITAMPDTDLHKKIGQAGKMPSQFAGFYDTKKSIAFTATSKGTDETIQQLKKFTTLFQMQAIQGLAQHNLSQDELAMAKDGITRLVKVMNATIEQGRLDLGCQFLYVPEHSTVLFGIKVVEGQELGEIIRQASENQLFADDEGTQATVVYNVDRIGEIKFHKLQPFPPSPVFGPNAELVLGISDEAFYVGLGNEPIKKLKEVIQKSQSMAADEQPLTKVSVDIPKVLQLVNNSMPEGQAPVPPKVLEAFGKKPGNTATFTATPIDNGILYQLEIAPNIVKVLMQGVGGIPGMPGGGIPGGMPGMPGGMPPGGLPEGFEIPSGMMPR